MALDLIREIFKCCSDNIHIFIKNLKTLRPVQVKEIKDMLSEVEKG